MSARIGSLFTGYGGLDLAVQATLGGTIAWHCEIEPAPARLLEHHHPGVPNIGDITAVDWSTVEPVDLLTGGFPCQDVSAAGRRAGLRPDTRSGLWAHMAYAIDRLRPRLVVIENVRGLLSADAACELEPCPWCVGDGDGRPLRALGAVLGDLADLGYDARWCGLRAADVGAPHGRYRVFIAAWPRSDPDSAGVGCGAARGDDGVRAEGLESLAVADADGVGSVRGGSARGRRRGPAHHHLAAADTDRPGREGSEPARGRDMSARGAAPDASGDRRSEGRPEPAGLVGGSDAPVSGAHTAPDTLRDGREGRQERDLGQEARQSAPLGADPAGRVLDWGSYGPAIRRWELILGRPAPAPTATGKRGGQQLSPAFVEFLMGLPEGHVTAVPGLTRNEQLKLLGNGVVPQQATAALRWLLADMDAERAA